MRPRPRRSGRDRKGKPCDEPAEELVVLSVTNEGAVGLGDTHNAEYGETPSNRSQKEGPQFVGRWWLRLIAGGVGMWGDYSPIPKDPDAELNKRLRK
jgi:hypothetical protein